MNQEERVVKELTERQLEEVKRHYDNIPYGFCVLRVDLDENECPKQWTMVYVNDAMSEAVGISKNELFQKKLISLAPQKKQERLDIYYRVAYQGVHLDTEKYSKEIKKYLRITCYQYEYGYMACILKDVTKNHMLEISLKSMMHSCQEITVINLEEDYCYTLYPKYETDNERICYSKLIENRISEGIIFENQEGNVRNYLSTDNIRKALEKDDMVEIRYYRKDQWGKKEWCSTTFTIGERDAYGKAKTTIATIRSINELVRGEETQRNLLEEAVRQAEAANLAKSNFLSTMSHDMRTPLNVIFGMSKLAKINYDNPEKVLDYLNKINASSKHLLSLINEVLDMSKIESGKEELLEEEFSIVEMMQEVIEMAKGMILEKQQTLNYEMVNVTHEHVLGDSNRLQQVLFNLISNAEKYSEVNGNIDIILEEIPFCDSQYARFVIHVKDDGIGMSKEFLPQVFEPFKREEDSRISKIQGTGLGMTIARTMMRQMGGNIQVSSVLGEGSEFIVNVPLKIHEDAEVITNTDLQAESANREPQENMFFDIHALLVEDNTWNAEITAELLKYLGLKVTYAEDGKVALDKFINSEEGLFDCIFMDVQMPEMDGLEATMRIRELYRTDACIPIFAMTANVFTDDVNNTRRAGMQEHIGKPMELENICRILCKWFPDKLQNTI